MRGAIAGPAAVLTRSLIMSLSSLMTDRSAPAHLLPTTAVLSDAPHSLVPAGLIQSWPVSLRASEQSAAASRVSQRVTLTLLTLLVLPLSRVQV